MCSGHHSKLEGNLVSLIMPLRHIFIEFNTPEEAERARGAMNKHPFDARHRFQINLLSDIETFKDMDETYEDPKPEEFTPRVGPFLC